jgi:hypothetical protein
MERMRHGKAKKKAATAAFSKPFQQAASRTVANANTCDTVGVADASQPPNAFWADTAVTMSYDTDRGLGLVTERPIRAGAVFARGVIERDVTELHYTVAVPGGGGHYVRRPGCPCICRM